MGATSSRHKGHPSNDFELVIRSAKELEYLLTFSLGAQGSGIHEQINSLNGRLPDRLVRRLRFIATIRNKVVHEYGCDAIPDRPRFVAEYDAAVAELRAMIDGMRAAKPADTGCIVS